MHRLKSIAFSEGQMIVNLPNGRNIRGLYLTFDGVNDTGATYALADLGNIRIDVNHRERINAPTSIFSYLTDLYGGVAEQTSTISAAFRFSVFISFRQKFDQLNVLVPRNDDVQFTLNQFNTVKPVSGKIQLYAIYDDTGKEKYIPVLRTQSEPFVAAGARTIELSQNNIEQLYLIADANISTVQVLRDGKSVLDADEADILSFSNAINSTETAITFIELVAPRNAFLSMIQKTSLQINASAALAGSKADIVYFATETR